MTSALGVETIQQRLSDLEKHLDQENPVLLKSVQGFRELDHVAQRMGLLPVNASLASRIPWWPLISVLGTFSAGKSTFINDFLGETIQRTGNQAVDDRFTVVVYSPETRSHALPGVSLDADPRFPFYQMSQRIETVDGGEGKRIDAYLQLKTCNSERLRGKILIDSPGFDADAQRDAILSITDHMIDLSDLVLVIFDARHPEPGAMRDTLEHLVVRTKNRGDSSKFLFILNQLDAASREDNPEDLVASWLRSLGEVGMTTGRFYTIFSPSAAPIEDPIRRQRFEQKRDADLEEIYQRMDQVEVERAYRIVASLKKTATEIASESAPLLIRAQHRWRQYSLMGDALMLSAAFVLFLIWSISAGDWSGLSYQPQWLDWFTNQGAHFVDEVAIGLVIAILVAGHFGIRKLAGLNVSHWLSKEANKRHIEGDILGAFRKSISPLRPVLLGKPSGWNAGAQKSIAKVLNDCEAYVQTLNERFTNPRGLKE